MEESKPKFKIDIIPSIQIPGGFYGRRVCTDTGKPLFVTGIKTGKGARSRARKDAKNGSE